MASLSVIDRVGVMMFTLTGGVAFPLNTNIIPPMGANTNPLMDTLLPWDSAAFCQFTAFINSINGGLTFLGDPNLGDPTILLQGALTRMINSRNAGNLVSSPCPRASNIVFFTGQDITPAQLQTMSAIQFGQNNVNLWIVHPGNNVLTGNVQGSLLNTNLYTLQCFQETAIMGKNNINIQTNGFMVSMTAPNLANVFSQYYALFQPFKTGTITPSPAYLDSVTNKPIITNTMVVTTPQAVNVLAEPPTAPLDYICGIDVIQTAAVTPPPLPASMPCAVALKATPTPQALVTNAANAQPILPNTCPTRTAVSTLDLDHNVRLAAGSPCVVTQTYWLDGAGKPRINRFVELGVAVVLNILWFILTWVHNPLGCCVCLDKAKKLKKVQEQLDDRMDLFLTPEERAKLKQKAIDAERTNFKKGDMKTALAAEADSKSIQAKNPRTIPNLGKGLSSEDEYFDPDSDQSSDVSFSSRGRT